MIPLRPPEDAIDPRTRAAWRRWLERHHDRGQGAWVVIAKKDALRRRLGYEEAVEEALCFGWVDSRTRSLDDESRMLWMSPRRRGSPWSAANKRRVERLIGAGLMAAPGLACVEAARRDGSWSAMDAVDALEIPDDLAKALSAAGGLDNFRRFPPGSRRNVLAWIQSARRSETRARRIAETARLAAMNIRVHDFITMARARRG